MRNTGFMFEDRVFHPGDAYTDPHTPVDLLFVPEFGLFTKFGHAIDFIRQVKPKQASPVHDTGLDAQGLAGAGGFLAQHKTPPRHRLPVRPTAQEHNHQHLSSNGSPSAALVT